MEREAASTLAVDLFANVLARQDATSYVIARTKSGRCSATVSSRRHRAHELRELLALIKQGRLLRPLGDLAPSGPCRASLPGTPDAARPDPRPPAAGKPPYLVTRHHPLPRRSEQPGAATTRRRPGSRERRSA